MKTYRADFKGETFQAQGRNGMMQCKGIAINAYDNMVAIMPITSKGYTGNCFIDIPKNDIPAMVDFLLTTIEGRDK